MKSEYINENHIVLIQVMYPTIEDRYVHVVPSKWKRWLFGSRPNFKVAPNTEPYDVFGRVLPDRKWNPKTFHKRFYTKKHRGKHVVFYRNTLLVYVNAGDKLQEYEFYDYEAYEQSSYLRTKYPYLQVNTI